jgi:hypothetical protein
LDIAFTLPSFTAHCLCNGEFSVINGLSHPVILGRDIIEKLGFFLDFKNKVIHWEELNTPMPSSPATKEELRNIASSSYFQNSSSILQQSEECLDHILDAQYDKVLLEQCIPAELQLEQKEELLATLHPFENIVFTPTLGIMKAAPYVITIKDNAMPFSAKPFSIPQSQMETFRKEIEQLIGLGVIEKDDCSPWAVPCFIIPKKNKTVRFLTNFCCLNAQLIRYPYPLTRISVMLQNIPAYQWISTLDINMGYYTRELADSSKQLTAFVLLLGKFCYR